MPQRRTAKKDLRQNKKRYQANLKIKQRMKAAIQKFKKSLADSDAASRKNSLKELYKALEKAAVKKVIHPNKAARKKSRLSKLLRKKKASPKESQ